MKKTGALFVLFLSFLFCQLPLASDVAGSDSFWDSLRRKMETVTPAKKTTATAAVGGVRGAKNDAASDLYWKGKSQAVDVNDEELRAFNLALQSAVLGEEEEASRLFNDFLTTYPESILAEDATEALARLTSVQ